MHVCPSCGCDVFTLIDKNGYKVPECMGCGSTKPPVKTGIDRAPKEDKRWNPDKALKEFTGEQYWIDKRKEWLDEWYKRVGNNRRN